MTTTRVPAQKALIATLIALYCVFTLTRYQGSNGGLFILLYQWLLNPDLFANDFYLHNSDINKASILWDAVRMFSINVDNDFVGLALHAAAAAIAAAAVLAIIRVHFRVRELHWALLLLLACVFLDNKVLDITHGSVIYLWTGSPAMFGHALSLLAMFLLLGNRILPASLVLALGVAVAAKVMWFPAVAAALYVWFNPDVDRRKLVFVAIPFIVAYVKSRSLVAPLTPGEAAYVSEEWMRLWADEISIHMQPWRAQVLYAATLLAFPWFWRRLEDRALRVLTMVIYVSTLGLYVGGGLYTLVGWEILPRPMLIQLGFIRPTKFLQLFLYLTILAEIARSDGIDWRERAAIFVALVLLRVTSMAGVAAPLAVLAAGFGVTRHSDFAAVRWKAMESWMLAAFFVALAGYQVLVSSPIAHPNAEGFRHLNKWTLLERFTPEEWETLLALREREDFVMLMIARKGEAFKARYQANLVARKSGFHGSPAHFMRNAANMSEAVNRGNAVDRVIDALAGKSPLSQGDKAFLAERRVGLVLPKGATRALPGARVAAVLPHHEILRYDQAR